LRKKYHKINSENLIEKKRWRADLSPNNVPGSWHRWGACAFGKCLLSNVDLCQCAPPTGSNTATHGRTCPGVLLTLFCCLALVKMETASAD